jgi:hypothetical protein
MGIYSNGKIFGLRIYTFNDDDFAHTLFEEKYNEIISVHQLREAYLFYNELNDKNNIFFNVYTECITTHDMHNREKFMMWHPMSLEQFLEKIEL